MRYTVKRREIPAWGGCASLMPVFFLMVHIDTDEGNAWGLENGDEVRLINIHAVCSTVL